MKIIYKNIGIWAISLIIVSCSSSQRQVANEANGKVNLVILDPGHFHASLLQKDTLAAINDTIWIYAPKGIEVDQYLKSIDSYNQRAEKPTAWVKQLYTADDYLSKMLAGHQGMLWCWLETTGKKTQYIIESVKAGCNVLADKPLAINQQDFKQLLDAYQLAKEKKLLLYDLMTERYDILNMIEKELMHQKGLFGELQKGLPDNPSITMESVHHFFKNVSGKPLIRPAWYYDVAQQGEGIADVTTHLIDLIQWQCFPNEAIHYQSDVEVTDAKHWPTSITLSEFSQSTLIDSFPPYLDKYVKNDILEVMANGTLNFTIKGINIGMKVSWNYAPPASGGDTFTSIKKGSKATLEIIQNKSNNFIRQLYIRKENKTDTATFEMELQKAVGQLQKTYPFLSVKK